MRALLGIDLTDQEGAARIIAQASDFVTRLGYTLDLTFIDGLPYAAYLIHDPSLRELFDREADKLKADHERRLEGMLEKIPEAHRGKAIPQYGAAPEKVLCELASGYELLIVGTHGRTGAQHLFLGSTAERVIRHATVPTLVLRCGRDA